MKIKTIGEQVTITLESFREQTMLRAALVNPVVLSHEGVDKQLREHKEPILQEDELDVPAYIYSKLVSNIFNLPQIETPVTKIEETDYVGEYNSLVGKYYRLYDSLLIKVNKIKYLTKKHIVIEVLTVFTPENGGLEIEGNGEYHLEKDEELEEISQETFLSLLETSIKHTKDILFK